MDVEQDLAAWGNHDRDAPFPLFAELRERGAVHHVTLADGHDAWLVVKHDEAKAALGDPRLSKDMHTALASGGGVVAEGLPGPAFARHMLVVDPPDHTRLRRLVAAAFSVRRIEGLREHVQTIIDDLLDAIAAQGPQTEVDLVAAFAFPLPFTVICELLGVPVDQREPFADELQTLLAPAPTPEDYARAKEASDAVVAKLTALVETKQLHALRRLDRRADRSARRRRAAQSARAPLDDLPADHRRARHDGQPHREQRRRAAVQSASSSPSCAPSPKRSARRSRNSSATTRRCPTQPSGTRSNRSSSAASRFPPARKSSSTWHRPTATRDFYAHPETLDIDRTDNRHLAFGHGIHFCLGAPLARMEGQLALNTLLRRFPELRLAVPSDELHWGHGDGLVLRGLSELPVIPGPAVPRATSRA